MPFAVYDPRLAEIGGDGLVYHYKDQAAGRRDRHGQVVVELVEVKVNPTYRLLDERGVVVSTAQIPDCLARVVTNNDDEVAKACSTVNETGKASIEGLHCEVFVLEKIE